jgi:hypothetical protein
MALLIAKGAPLIVGWRFRRRCADRRRPVGGNTAATNTVLGVRGMPTATGMPATASLSVRRTSVIALREHGERKQQNYCRQSEKVFHALASAIVQI